MEILLALALLLPLLFPRGAGLDRALGGLLFPLLPAMGARPEADADEEVWREFSYRLIEENARLRARLVALGEPARLVAEDEAYFARRPLRVEASVRARDASPFRGSVVVSAGRREGLRPGLPALVGNALVGVVAEVGPRSSWVRLLTDPGQRVWAEVVGEEEAAEGYVEGAGEGTLFMELVRAESGKVGDPVITGGGNREIPRGLLVGTVSAFGDLDRNGVAEVEVRPAVKAAELRYVHVLVPGEN